MSSGRSPTCVGPSPLIWPRKSRKFIRIFQSPKCINTTWSIAWTGLSLQFTTHFDGTLDSRHAVVVMEPNTVQDFSVIWVPILKTLKSGYLRWFSQTVFDSSPKSRDFLYSKGLTRKNFLLSALRRELLRQKSKRRHLSSKCTEIASKECNQTFFSGRNMLNLIKLSSLPEHVSQLAKIAMFISFSSLPSSGRKFSF